MLHSYAFLLHGRWRGCQSLVFATLRAALPWACSASGCLHPAKRTSGTLGSSPVQTAAAVHITSPTPFAAARQVMGSGWWSSEIIRRSKLNNLASMKAVRARSRTLMTARTNRLSFNESINILIWILRLLKRNITHCSLPNQINVAFGHFSLEFS